MLYDIEAEIPSFLYITPANIYDSKTIPKFHTNQELITYLSARITISAILI